MQQIVLIILSIYLPGSLGLSEQSLTEASGNSWDIRLTESTIDCIEQKICYQLELKSNTTDWTLGDQNYRLFFDGALMTVDSVKSLLPATHYSAATINQNVTITGQGQEAFSPLDSIDQNLGFLDFSVTQTDRSDPAAAFQVSSSVYSPVAEICLTVAPVVLQDETMNNCIYFYHSRPETAGSITNQYTTLTENNGPGTSTSTIADTYEDFTPLTTPEACPASSCITPDTWDIRISESSLNCGQNSICYNLELRSGTTDWTLSDQNYRLFFGGALSTVDSVKSLLPTSHYGAAVINQNIKISGQGQEPFSPLDSIDQNLGFLDFSITQTDRSDPTAAFQLSASTYTAVAEICLSVEPVVLQDLSLSNCIYLYHSRPETAGTITNQYTTLTENNIPNTSTSTTSNSYEDFTPLNTAAACPSPACACQANHQTISP